MNLETQECSNKLVHAILHTQTSYLVVKKNLRKKDRNKNIGTKIDDDYNLKHSRTIAGK